MNPKYKDRKFKTEKEFNDWLKQTATTKIRIEDRGQDFLEFYIDERGEVLHTAPCGARLWNGKMVDLKMLKPAFPLVFKGDCTLIYGVVAIEKLHGHAKKISERDKESISPSVRLKRILEKLGEDNEDADLKVDTCSIHGETIYLILETDGGYDATSACAKCLKELVQDTKSLKELMHELNEERHQKLKLNNKTRV